jgi:hypothetical protein
MFMNIYTILRAKRNKLLAACGTLVIFCIFMQKIRLTGLLWEFVGLLNNELPRPKAPPRTGERVLSGLLGITPAHSNKINVIKVAV